MFRNPGQSIFRCNFVSSARQIRCTHTRVACRPHTAPACRAARARRSVRIPCNQTESFPPRAIER
ncbi:hypothetical protein CFB81_23010 [Burkholderia sp. AU28863]|nr:hypothetical protein CFB81_23010 [Burkholderia sp. AU28863]